MFERFTHRARKAISGLVDLSPTVARCRCPHDGDIEEKTVEDVALGAVVVVRPGDKIPLDGTIVKGSTTVNQSGGAHPEQVPGCFGGRKICPGAQLASARDVTTRRRKEAHDQSARRPYVWADRVSARSEAS